MSDAQWERLRIPVGLGFFFFGSSAQRTVVLYPSPVGPTESLLELDTWHELEESNPVLERMRRDVEALLVNRTRGTRQYFLVPIDDCYRLVAVVRTHWKGLGGGQRVWKEIGRFFDELKERSRPAKAGEVLHRTSEA